MTIIGTPFSTTAKKVLLLGSGELGKEVAIELQRLGVEVIAADRYANAPAMQVADRSYTFSMLDGQKLRDVVEKERPDLIVPEIEAIATEVLVELEEIGFTIVPSASATQLTMNREGIRSLAADTLNLATSPFEFAANKDQFTAAVERIGIPCVVKPIMSSSGKGQSLIRCEAEICDAWSCAQEGGRAGAGKVIIEGFVEFDYEITLLTIRHNDGNGGTTTSFCQPIGHRQEDGDYQESWQPQAMSNDAWQAAKNMAEKVTGALGGWGLFGVELFIKGNDVLFSEVSPRPHDTGMVTLISQDLSEFALHARAILGLPIPNIVLHGPSASSVILVSGESTKTSFGNLTQALLNTNTQLRLFGKPEVSGRRRMGVALARDLDIEKARIKANHITSSITVSL
jgi:phosphoribosylglycinamide formyltransferase 2